MNDKAKKVFYMGMDPTFAEETLITTAWQTSNAGKKIVYKLPLSKLQPDMVFIPLVRGPDRTPMKAEVFDPVQQRKVVKTLPAKELVGELKECPPVAVATFWRAANTAAATVDDFAAVALSGDFDASGFIDAMNRSAATHGAYARTHHGDDHSTLTLTWGA